MSDSPPLDFPPDRRQATDSPAGADDPIRFCISADLTVLSSAPAAIVEAEAGGWLRVAVGTKLHVRNAKAQKQLIDGIALLAKNPACTRAFVQLDESELHRSRFLVLSRVAADTANAADARYLVTLCNLDADVSLTSETLEQCFGLTPMEARLCLVLLDARSLQNFADKYDLTIATARWHWTNIREKLNVHTQIELVRLLLRLTRP